MPSPATLEEPEVDDAFGVPPECMPNYDLIVTEDDTPVDSLFSFRQMTLLCDSFYASWPRSGEERPFVAMSNVGLFFALKQPPLVPDFLLSVGVTVPEDLLPKSNRSYFIWNYGKPPDLVAEFVSNKEGGEDDLKRIAYARIGIPYYIIYDPLNLLGNGALQILERRMGRYVPLPDQTLPELGLSVVLWNGHYAGSHHEWLRFVDRNGQMLLTGEELAVQERQRADQSEEESRHAKLRVEQESLRADAEKQNALQERERSEKLAAQLRALGIEPNV